MKAKITQFFKECVLHKYANRFSVAKILFAGLVVVFFGVTSIRAQIGGDDLYGQQTGDFAGVSSLMLAVSNNDIEGVRFFSRAGGFLINQKNIGGATALHIAARNGNLEITIVLLENGADVNIADNEGWTPLMRAAVAGNAKIIEAFLGKGANVALLNSNRESVLAHATLSDCFDCLNIIFTKSDLIKTMDTKLLKEQLIDAFIIARNRENKMTQNLLEGYLDRVTKMTPLVISAADVNAASAANVITTSTSTAQEFLAQNGKVKYILVDEGKSVPTQPIATAAAIYTPTIVSQSPLVAPLTPMPTPIPSTETTISNLVQSALQPNTSAVSNSVTNSQNRVITKFKFVSGAPGISMPTEVYKAAPQTSNGIHYEFHAGSKKLYAAVVAPPKQIQKRSEVISTPTTAIITAPAAAPVPAAAIKTSQSQQPPRNIAPIDPANNAVSDAEKSITLELNPQK